jgi:nicotinamide riboside transporter PnuC
MELSELQATTTELMGAKLDQLQQRSLIAAVIGLVLCLVGAVLGSAGTGYNALGGFFQSYLYAYLFWFGVTSGSLGLLMVHHAVGGGW